MNFTDPHTCPIGAGHYRFRSREDLDIYMARVSQERMEYTARHLMELGQGSELARQITRKRGAAFLDRLREIARQLQKAAA